MTDDDWDPDDYLDSLTPDECRQVAEVWNLDDHLHDHQAALEQIAHDDPVGFCWFGDRDDWVDSRLSGKPPK